MKKNILLLGIAFLGLYSCQQSTSENFTLTGEIDGLPESSIYLSWRNGDSTYTDSAAVNEGTFTFNDNVENPVLARIYGDSLKGYIWFYLENSDINVIGQADSIHKTVDITGSIAEDEYASFKDLMQGFNDQERALYKEYTDAREAGDSAKMTEIENRSNEINDQKNEKTREFIQQNPQSFVSLRQMESLAYGSSYEELNEMFAGLQENVKNSIPGKKFADRLDIMAKTALGNSALDFTQNDVEGNPVSLSDFEGKYVLVDFWASWCGPCRAENPNVVKAFNTYKDEGFTVLGVSLDEDSTKWTKAIADDHLDWTQVSDLEGWKNAVAQQYGVRAIPANYLIDPEGTIIGHNLRGEDLKNKLKELFD